MELELRKKEPNNKYPVGNHQINEHYQKRLIRTDPRLL